MRDPASAFDGLLPRWAQERPPGQMDPHRSVQVKETLAAGEPACAGLVVGRVDQTRHMRMSRADASDGSQAPRGFIVAIGDVRPASARDPGSREVMVTLLGKVYLDFLVIGPGHTAQSVGAAFDARGIEIFDRGLKPHHYTP